VSKSAGEHPLSSYIIIELAPIIRLSQGVHPVNGEMINIAYFICVFYNYENSCHDEIGRSHVLTPMLRDIGGIDIITKE
jgi:hypothetical protein